MDALLKRRKFAGLCLWRRIGNRKRDSTGAPATKLSESTRDNEGQNLIQSVGQKGT